MALKDALKCLDGKLVLGEYGPCTRPFVILDVDEYQMIREEIESASKRRRVPREQSRENQAI